MNDLLDTKKLRNFKNKFLQKDVLFIYLKKKFFYKKIKEAIDILGIKNENLEDLNKISLDLEAKEDIYVDKKWKDIYYKKRSIWCTYCTMWKWCTVVLSYKCHRDCFFCYDETPLDPKVKIDPYKKEDMDKIYNLIDSSLSDISNKTLAITWWEPFLFTDKVYEILSYVNSKYPGKHKRIYTTWDIMNESILQKLKDLGLDEIRYSIKPWEEPNLKVYAMTKKYIPTVLIEMPVMPDSLDYMIDILTKINNDWSIDWVNLNELTFNNFNRNKFAEKWYKLDTYIDSRDLYHRYFGVPKIEIWIYGSKKICLELINYFSSKETNFFIHYCDLDTVSYHYYLYKINYAENLWIKYSKINNFWLHKVLRVYWKFNNYDFWDIDYTIFWNYIETSLNNINLFDDRFEKIIIYKNFDYSYAVDFEEF